MLRKLDLVTIDQREIDYCCLNLVVLRKVIEIGVVVV